MPFTGSGTTSNVSPTATPSKSLPSSTVQKPTVRKRTRKDTSPSAGTLRNSDSDDEGGSEDPITSTLENIHDNDDDDDMDIFSPTLSPERRIVESKVASDGLVLYRTAQGEWLSEAELRRLANMARNARLLSELGIEDAKRRLTARSGGQEEEKEPELEDDRAFSVGRAQPSLAPRERHPRQSKQGVS